MVYCGKLVKVVTLWGGEGGEGSHMKRLGMLVVSLSGVNQRFWSLLGCSGQNDTTFNMNLKSQMSHSLLIFCVSFLPLVLKSFRSGESALLLFIIKFLTTSVN